VAKTKTRKKRVNKLHNRLSPIYVLVSVVIAFGGYFVGYQVGDDSSKLPVQEEVVESLRFPETGQDIVLEVLDGDTFVLPGKQRVRLMRVQAPEIENCGGKEAKSRLEELVLGKEVTLKGVIVGGFGRLVAFVYVEDILVNEVMLKEGLVGYLGVSPDQPMSLQPAIDYARENKVGIYGEECLPINPPSPECLIKGNVAQDDSRKIFHFPGCSGYDRIKVERYWGDDWFCAEEEAKKAGFTKSKNCFGKKFN
jgi:micrococcal nuclease